MRLFAFGVVALGTLGCDALVGGVCAVGYVVEDDTCVPTADPDPTDAGGQGGGGGEPVAGGPSTGGAASCPPPLSACGDVCVDLDADAEHCGACHDACATGLCTDGICEDDPTGHAVIIGMSFEKSSPPSRRLLGNALFLPLPDPLLYLDYRQYARPGVAAAVDDAVAEQAALRKRTYQRFTVENAGQLPAELASGTYHLVLVHDQALASPAAMATAGAFVAPSLQAFAEAGGVIVVLASHDGPAMPTFLTQSGLLATTAMVSLDGEPLANVAPTDAIGIGVASSFLASTRSSAFVFSEPTGPTLAPVVSSDEAVAVLHRAFVPHLSN